MISIVLHLILARSGMLNLAKVTRALSGGYGFVVLLPTWTSRFVKVFRGHPKMHLKFNYTYFSFESSKIWADHVTIFKRRKVLASNFG